MRMSSIAKRVLLKLGRRSPVVWSVPEKGRQVAITFDDGPTEWTPKVLDVLAQAGVRATFFVLGCEVEKRPGILVRIVREGHEIGIHGYEHTHRCFAQQVKRCANDFKQYGIAPRVVRPPHGRVEGLAAMGLWLRGCRTVLYSFDTHDSMRQEGKWREGLPDYSAIRGGDVVLMHDDNPVCVEELSVLLQVMKEKNLQAVTVSALMTPITNSKKR
jgi:peptidoglycan/xylan/chitin deacetylase (PgdA/CDA1 family)